MAREIAMRFEVVWRQQAKEEASSILDVAEEEAGRADDEVSLVEEFELA